MNLFEAHQIVGEYVVFMADNKFKNYACVGFPISKTPFTKIGWNHKLIEASQLNLSHEML